MRYRWIFFFCVSCVASGPWIGWVDASDVQVNTFTANDQRFQEVAINDDGDFVVVWASLGSPGTDTAYWSVQGQRYAPDGATVADQFQVNTYTTDGQLVPAVAVGVGGEFIVVWDSAGSTGTDSSLESIQGQRFAADGSPAGGEFQVNTYTTFAQTSPLVAIAPLGDFVVTWNSSGSFGTDSSSSSVQGQRYDSEGLAQGEQFQVNTYTTSFQFVASAMAFDAEGDALSVWWSDGSSGTDSSNESVQAQRYAPDGSPSGGEFQINTYTTSRQLAPTIARNGSGDFVVVWASDGSPENDDSSFSILGQRYDAAGAPVGDEFQVNTYTTDSQFWPQVGLDAAGDFVVTWVSDGSPGTDTSGSSIHGQRFAADGTRLGGQFQINTYTSNDQDRPVMAMNAAGDFVVAWESVGSSGNDTDGTSVQMRLFTAQIFADGFESGDLSAW